MSAATSLMMVIEPRTFDPGSNGFQQGVITAFHH
jgi:hypothetical protein